jgi:hypothetical protein
VAPADRFSALICPRGLSVSATAESFRTVAAAEPERHRVFHRPVECKAVTNLDNTKRSIYPAVTLWESFVGLHIWWRQEQFFWKTEKKSIDVERANIKHTTNFCEAHLLHRRKDVRKINCRHDYPSCTSCEEL